MAAGQTKANVASAHYLDPRPAGYRLTLEGASEFCAWGSVLSGDSFDGSFRLGDTIYSVDAFVESDYETFERRRTVAAYGGGIEFTVALERIGGRILEVTRSEPGRGFLVRSPPACRGAN